MIYYKWPLIVSTLGVSLFFITRYFLPWLLGTLQSNIRFTSVSPRSIRGIHFKAGTLTVSIDRIGFSFHSPTNSFAKHVHIQIQGLAVTIAERTSIKVSPPTVFPSAPVRSGSGLLNAKYMPKSGLLDILFFPWFNVHLRPLFRKFFVVLLRKVIEFLPRIMRLLDFELDRVIVTHSGSVGAHLLVNGVTLGAKVGLSKSKSELSELPIETEELPGRRHKRLYQWSDQLFGSSRRVFRRAWLGTSGHLELGFKIDEFSLVDGLPVVMSESRVTEPPSNNVFASPPRSPSVWSFTSNAVPSIHGLQASEAAISMPMPAKLRFSLSFSPSGIEDNSLTLSLHVPAIHLQSNSLISITDRWGTKTRPRALSSVTPSQGTKSPGVLGVAPVNDSYLSLKGRGKFGSIVPQPDSGAGGGFHKQHISRMLGALDLKLSSLQVSHTFEHAPSNRKTVLSSLVRRMFFKVGLSDPTQNPMHRNWIGRPAKPNSKLDASVFSISCGLSAVEIFRVQHHSTSVRSLRLAKLGKSSIDMIATQWDAVGLPKGRLFGEDYNAALVVAEVRGEHVHFTERVKDLRATMDLFKTSPKELPDNNDSGPSPPPRTVLARHLPRIVVDLAVTDIQIKLQCDDLDNPFLSAFDVYLATNQIEVHVSSTFEEPMVKRDEGSEFARASSDEMAVSLQLLYEGSVTLAPLEMSVVIDPKSPMDDAEWNLTKEGDDSSAESSSSFPSGSTYISSAFIPPKMERVLAIHGLEAGMSGRALGRLNSKQAHHFAIPDFFTEAKARVDEVTLDLRYPPFLPSFIVLARALSVPPTSHFAGGVMSKLIPGVMFYCWIGVIRAAVSEEDINPNIRYTMPLRRGVAMQTGLVFEYCYLTAPHVSAERMAQSVSTRGVSARQSLDVRKEDLYNEAVAQTLDLAESGTRVALLWLEFIHPSCWIVESISDTSDELPCRPIDRRSAEGVVEVHESVFLDLPLTTIRIPITSRELTNGGFSEEIHITAESPRVYWCLQLPIIYSMLLSLRQFQYHTALFPPRGVDHNQHPHISLRIDVKDVQGLCICPNSARVYSRFSAFGLVWAASSKARLTSQSAFLWVPSAQGHLEGKWEEIVRVKSLSVEVEALSPLLSNFIIDCSLGGARLRIPYRYNLHTLIFGITIMIKAIKQLRRDAAAGKVAEIVLPTPEGARIPPKVSIRVEFLTIEAADDPFEARLNLIWRAGLDEQKSRLERALAFEAKVAAIQSAGSKRAPNRRAGFEWHFGQSHTVEPSEAWVRLLHYDSESWIQRFKAADAEQVRREGVHLKRSKDPTCPPFSWSTIQTIPTQKVVPLCRASFTRLFVSIGSPSFGGESGLRTFMSDLGSGLPHSTLFTLLIPFQVTWTSNSIQLSIRDYPLPIINIPSKGQEDEGPAWRFETDMVICEEYASSESVTLVPCVIYREDERLGFPAFEIQIPKTIMPVKSYAHPTITVTTPHTTNFTWGMSLAPMMADVMQVVDSITPPPRDPSPALGFWDKLRLIFHWRLKANFIGDVHIHVKGTRNPYIIDGLGAGLVMEWKGSPIFTVGLSEQDQESLQLRSSQMLLVIPDLKRFSDAAAVGLTEPADEVHSSSSNPSRRRPVKGKVVAKFNNGVRMGMGFLFERSVDGSHNGPISEEARIFHFRPHYDVKLRDPQSCSDPTQDSYAGFRSRFIHLAISLASAAEAKEARDGDNKHAAYSIFHLSPKTFTHFWSWWDLFKSLASSPIRQGALFSSARPPSPKFSRHLATIKYRITLEPLLISHVYNQEEKAGWKEGLTSCVGIKVMVNQFQTDMHQREELFIEKNSTGKTMLVPHKPFYSSEVVLTGLELRAVRAVFAEPQKALFSTSMTTEDPDFSVPDDDPEPFSSPWVDLDDFVETDWVPSDPSPKIWLLPCGFCPRFTYLKRVPLKDFAHPTHPSPFGNEDSHHCLQGMEDSIQEIQADLARKRLDELKRRFERLTSLIRSDAEGIVHPSAGSSVTDARAAVRDIEKRIRSLTDYVNLLDSASRRPLRHTHGPGLGAEDWSDFLNVYQVHCPRIILSNTIRDILIDYYWYSRNRRAFEYRMATRALKYIREQRISEPLDTAQPAPKGSQGPAKVLRRILANETRGQEKKFATSQKYGTAGDQGTPENPLQGWTDGVVAKRNDFVLLLKPQVILRSELNPDSNLIAVVDSATLQHIPILDRQSIDDVVHGLIMQRNYVKLTGLQVFAPNDQVLDPTLQDSLVVPLEVIVDYRYDHDGFSRLLSQSDGTLHYDKFNRLRVQNGALSHLHNITEVSEHIRNYTDRVSVHIPRFSVSAKSNEFAAIYTIVTDLLLYHDPMQNKHNEAFERFVYLYDFKDRNLTANVVGNMQEHLRQLQHVAEGYELHFDELDQDGKLDLLAIKSQIYSLATELGFIFEGISRVQARREDSDNLETFAIRLDAVSSDISWNMLDVNGSLLAKLAIRGVQYSWLTRTDSSMSNRVLVDDLQGLNGSPNAVFSEMVVKYEPTGAPFLLADWSSLPAVGGISIIELFDLRLHPLRLQIEKRTGRRIKAYIFSRPQRDDSKEQEFVDEGNATPGASRRSFDPPGQDRPSSHKSLVRSSSQQNLQQKSWSGLAEYRPRKLRKVSSSERLHKAQATWGATDPNDPPLENPDVEEMRVRARQNRTFLHIQVSSLLCVLSYKRDGPLTLTTIPDLEDFKFQTPKFEYTNKIWSFEEAFNAMKKDLFREVWRQKGTLLREFASRAKLVTPRNFMTESTPTLTPALPSPQTQARRRWQHILRSLTVSPANAQTIEQTPSTSDENTGANPERLTSASPIVPRDVPGARGPFPESAARGDVTRGRVRTLLRKRPPAKDPRG